MNEDRLDTWKISSRNEQGGFQIGVCFKERMWEMQKHWDGFSGKDSGCPVWGFKMDCLIKYEQGKVGLDQNSSTLFNRENGWDLGKDRGYPQLFLNGILFYPKDTVDKQFLTVVAIPMDTMRFKKGYPQENE